MSHNKFPVTPAIRVLRNHKISWTDHLYAYESHGGTKVSARELGVDEHCMIKTLIMQDEHKKPLIVLMHGDCEVSTRNLARISSCKHIEPCAPEVANKHSGYLVGGTSPFGTRQSMPVYMEESITALPQIYINGGKRGYLIGLTPADLVAVLKPVLVNVAISHEPAKTDGVINT